MPDHRQFAVRLAEAFPLLQQADKAFFELLCHTGQHARLHRNQLICDQGLVCTHLALLLEGTVRIYKIGDTGREITLYRIGPGESCILTASCILSNERFPAIAVSETEIDALLIPANTVRQWLAESPVWRDYVFGLVAKRLGDVISIVDEVAFKRMDRRIIDYLLDHTAGAGHTLTATHQEIAYELGTSREVVSRILKDLANAELIRISRGAITILDTPGLASRV